MCELATIAAALSVASTIAGTVMQQQGRAAAQRAQEDAAARSAAKVSESQKEAHKLFQASLDQSQRGNVEEMARKRTAERAQGLLPPEVTTPAAARDGESDAVAAASAGGNRLALDDLLQQGMARATLGGGTDAFRDLATAVQPNADRIGLIGKDVEVENARLPQRMALAARAGGGLRDIGSLVSGVGTLTSAAVGGGAFGEDGAVTKGWDWLKGQLPLSEAKLDPFAMGKIY